MRRGRKLPIPNRREFVTPQCTIVERADVYTSGGRTAPAFPRRLPDRFIETPCGNGFATQAIGSLARSTEPGRFTGYTAVGNGGNGGRHYAVNGK